MAYDYIIDVTEADFEYEVISFSQNTLVLVDFWAKWCKPCKTLSPILEKLAHESQGGFRLARVDIDNNPNLALQFNIRSIPTIKAFGERKVVGELVGLQPEQRIREFLDRLAPPSPFSLSLEKAISLMMEQKWENASDLFNEILEQLPDQPDALLGLVKCSLATGDYYQGLNIIDSFPSSPQYALAQILLPFAKSLIDYSEGNLTEDNDLDAAFANCIRLCTKGKYPLALDGLLDILRQDKRYRSGVVRQVILGILEMMGENDPLTRQYRSELASVLF